MRISVIVFCAFIIASPAFAAKKKIIFIAGKKSHGSGHHEYEAGNAFFAQCFGNRYRVELHKNGWVSDEKTLDDAATVVLFSDGSNGTNPAGNPLTTGNRLEVLNKHMKRGCGLVVIHYSTFIPKAKGGDQYLEWLGGFYDYESGPDNKGKKWWSALDTFESQVNPAQKKHPILRGVRGFKLRDEYYFDMRFRGASRQNDVTQDPRITPIYTINAPGGKNNQVVAWAVQRTKAEGGGRGFSFTGGHFHNEWKNPNLLKTMLNAIAWTAGDEIPKKGINPQLPWHMKPQPRWAATELGPVFSATINAGAGGQTEKAIAIRLGAPKDLSGQDATIVFDTELLRMSAGITDHFVSFNTYRDGLGGTGHQVGEPFVFTNPDEPGWAKDGSFTDPRSDKRGPLPHDWAKYKGMYRYGKYVVLSYTVGGTDVLEMPSFSRSAGGAMITRTMEVGPSSKPMQMRVAKETPNIVVLANGGGEIKKANGSYQLYIPARNKAVLIDVKVWSGPADHVNEFIAENTTSSPVNIRKFTKGGPAVWTKPIVTKGTLGQGKGAYVVDTITIPFDNPYRVLMRPGGHDFFSNGDAAICTIDGDVWRVSGIDDKLEMMSWKRMATGLFQPLGLEIVDDTVYVLGRDQITRLHDLNNDGEADYYENFNNECKIGGHVHEYTTNLNTDPAGDFFYVKGNNGKQTEHDGSVIRVSKDGKEFEQFATGFRWPNGGGVGPDGTVTVADQQGTWVPASRVDIVRRGGFYGFMNAHHRKEAPKGFDGPLCWIPHGVDNSCGGQGWVTSDRWGPLEGHMLHMSYGKCKMFLVLQEKIADSGYTQEQAGVYEFPITKFQSGSMRATFNPKDGQLYVSGLKGWQTSGARDGCFHRVRYTGKKALMPKGLNIHANGIRVSFTDKLDKELAEDLESWAVEQWNYRWTSKYGSKEYSVKEPEKQGHDPVKVKSATVLRDGKSVFLEIDGLQKVMQMKIAYDLASTDDDDIVGAIYNTIHKLGPAYRE